MSVKQPQPHLVSYVAAQLRLLGYCIDPCSCLEQVVLEAAYAYAPPVHEQRCFSYGAIILNDDIGLKGLLGEHFENDHILIEKDLGRMHADGRQTFLVICADRAELWRSKSQTYSSEVDLFFLRDSVLFGDKSQPPTKVVARELAIVKRDEVGGLTIMNWDGVFQHRHGMWSFRQYQYAYKVEDYVAAHFKDTNLTRDQLIRSLLKVAVHILSPAGIGTTLVLKLSDAKNIDQMLQTKKAVSPPTMSLVSTAIHSTFAHVAAQMDGAIIVRPDGSIECIGAMLNPGHTYLKKVTSLGGSRQLSAQAFSLAAGDKALVITVSADGPIRAFFQGDIIENALQ